MHTITIGLDRLLTTSAVAEAVIGYAAALQRDHSADTVAIPIVLDGRTVTAQLLISATGPLLILPSSSAEIELTAAARTIEDLQRRRGRLEPVALESDLTDPPADLAFPDFDAYQ